MPHRDRRPASRGPGRCVRRGPRAAPASVWTARWARSTPASGSCSTQVRSSPVERGVRLPRRLGARPGCRARAASPPTWPPSRRPSVRTSDTPVSVYSGRAGLGLELAPQRARSPRHRGVVGVRAVAAADQPRLAAGRRADVARLELIDQHDLVPAPGEPPRQRCAERPGTHDHDALHARDGTKNGHARVAALASTLVIGHSVRGARDPRDAGGRRQAPVKVLVVGDVHGNEPAGEAIVAALRQRVASTASTFWLVRTGQPRRPRGAHAPERARRRPQPQLPVPLGEGRDGHLLPRPVGRARSPRRKALMRLVRRVRPQLGDLLPPAHGHHGPRARASTRRSSATTRAAPGCRCARCRTTTAPRSAGRTT